MAIVEKKFNVKNKFNDEIRCVIEYNDYGKNLPLIFIIHGFKGWKDWGFLPYLSKNLASANAITVRFDFSLNGMNENNDLVAYPEKFAANTVSREISDLIDIYSFCQDGTFLDVFQSEDIWDGRVYLIGHSLGGAISILATDKINSDGMVLLASVSRLARYTERQKIQWRKDGFLSFVNNRTGQELKINLSYLEDIEKNNYNEKLLNLMRNYKHPILILHGKEDLTVPVAEAFELFEAGKNNKQINLQIIEKTGHTFGIEHPFVKTNEALEKIIIMIKNFIGLK